MAKSIAEEIEAIITPEEAALIEKIPTQNPEAYDYFLKGMDPFQWETREGLEKAIQQIKEIRNAFWSDVKVTGDSKELNTELEKALRLADFIELGILMCTDALERNESCGAHFREEFQTQEGEAVRVDEAYSYVSAWEYDNGDYKLHKEVLEFEFVKPSVRSYK